MRFLCFGSQTIIAFRPRHVFQGQRRGTSARRNRLSARLFLSLSLPRRLPSRLLRRERAAVYVRLTVALNLFVFSLNPRSAAVAVHYYILKRKSRESFTVHSAGVDFSFSLESPR